MIVNVLHQGPNCVEVNIYNMLSYDIQWYNVQSFSLYLIVQMVDFADCTILLEHRVWLWTEP